MEITILDGYYYTKEHEWVKIEGSKARIGISDYAQQKLGDITYVEPTENGKVSETVRLPDGHRVRQGGQRSLYAPVRYTGSLQRRPEGAPELVNKSPYGDGWIAEIELSDSSEVKNLMDAKTYKDYTAGLE